MWSWVGLRVTRENQFTMVEFLERRRMKQVRKIWLEEVTHEVLQAVVKHQGLRMIEGICWRHGGYQTHPKVVLDTMDPRLLAKAVTKMEKLKLVCPLLTFRQVEAILTTISTGKCQLKDLQISCVNSMSELDPNLLARAVNQLENFDMSNNKLNMHQIEALLTAISKGHSKVKTLSIRCHDASTLDRGLLARAARRLKIVKLRYAIPPNMDAIKTAIEDSQWKQERTRPIIGTSLGSFSVYSLPWPINI